MKTSPLLAILLASAMVPAVVAHDPVGIPKNYCEDVFEWDVHDYAPPAKGLFIALGQDGNLLGDCNGDTIPADYDGHVEWAVGGGWLSADSGDGATTGSVFCFGEEAHHPVFGPFHVSDLVLGSSAAFVVAADTEYAAPPPDPSENCGDFESDVSQTCVGACTVPFPPGLDGTYQVYVCGTTGHIGGGWFSSVSPQAIVLCPDLPPVDPGPVYAPGPAAVMHFDGSGGPPSVTPGAGWTCTEPILSGDLYEIECDQPPVLAVQGFLPPCTDPFGVVGGTPVSSGTGSVRVSCKQFFGGFASASCTASWIGAGGCPAVLTGFYDLPLRCAANVVGTTIGGNLFAACGKA